MSVEELVKELNEIDDHLTTMAADKLEELAAENERLSERVETLESFRPHLAQGYSSDSMAAQASTAALSDIWKFLGVSNQTEAMSALAEKDKEIAALREALQPFAHFSHVFEAGIGNYPREDHQEFYRVATMKLGERTLTVGDFRRARNAGGKYAE